MLEISSLSKTFAHGDRSSGRQLRAVDDVSLEVGQGQLFTLLGPSGCGKTTTLRCVAGLEHPDRGRIVVAGRTMYSSQDRVQLPASARGLGMVFQSYAIWPHLNVFKNVAFPLVVLPRRRRPPKAEIAERVDRVLNVVQLGELAGRPATDLSGGQQQRLALARALVMEPPLVLLDEPLSNLDAKLRETMRFEFKRLQQDLGLTAVYVTHDQVEALAMSNAIAVMRGGRIEQIGTPKEIYERPSSRFVADFIGTSNFFEGTVTSSGAVATGAGEIRVDSHVRITHGDRVVLAVRPTGVRLAPATDTSPATWSGVVQTRAYLGDAVDYVVRVDGVGAAVHSRAATCNVYEPGDHVSVEITAASLVSAS